MINNKEKYYDTINILSKQELVREVFCDDNISILNIADKVYMVNVIESKKKYKKQDEQYITGFMADHEMIDYVSNGYGHYYKMLKAQKGALQLMKLNPKTIEKIRTFKKETLRNGPDKNINYETEAKLKDKMDNKLPTDKKGLLSKILGIIK